MSRQGIRPIVERTLPEEWRLMNMRLLPSRWLHVYNSLSGILRSVGSLDKPRYWNYVQDSITLCQRGHQSCPIPTPFHHPIRH